MANIQLYPDLFTIYTTNIKYATVYMLQKIHPKTLYQIIIHTHKIRMFYFTLQLKIELLPFIAAEFQKFIAHFQKIKKLNDEVMLNRLRNLAQLKISQLDRFYEQHYEDYRIAYIINYRARLRKLFVNNFINLNNSMPQKIKINTQLQKKLVISKDIKPIITNKSIPNLKIESKIVLPSSNKNQDNVRPLTSTSVNKSLSPAGSVISPRNFMLSSRTQRTNKSSNRPQSSLTNKLIENSKKSDMIKKELIKIEKPIITININANKKTKIKKQSAPQILKSVVSNIKGKTKLLTKQQYINYLNLHSD